MFEINNSYNVIEVIIYWLYYKWKIGWWMFLIFYVLLGVCGVIEVIMIEFCF